jgi:hypothetical protein
MPIKQCLALVLFIACAGAAWGQTTTPNLGLNNVPLGEGGDRGSYLAISHPSGTSSYGVSLPAVFGGISTSVLTTPTWYGITTTGTAGSTSYSYKITANDGAGGSTAASSAATIGTGNATLSGSNCVNLQRFRLTSANFDSVYRTTSSGTPSSTGLIGTISPNSLKLTNEYTFLDCGLAGNSATPPSSNTTGGMSVAGSISGESFTLGGNTITSWPSSAPAGTNELQASNGAGTATVAIAKVAAGSVLASTGTGATRAMQTKPVIEARDITGVDCTGATESSTALNALTNTQDTLSNKTLSFRGCPLVRLTSQWLIYGQEQVEIDLGGTWNTTASAGNQGNTIIGGCAGAAGSVIQVSRSGFTHIHGGALVARAPGCSSSNFTGSIMYTNSASGGYTTTENRLSDIWLTTSNQGGAITGYQGVYINGTPNQEEFKMQHVNIHCQLSQGSYGVVSTDGNADSTTFTLGTIKDCFAAANMVAGNIRITYSDISSNGMYSVFGSGAATLIGPVEEFSHNVVDGAGNMQIPNSGSAAGGTFGWNQFGLQDLDPAHYYFENGTGNDKFVFLGTNIINAGVNPKGNVLIGSTTYSTASIYTLGTFTLNNQLAPACCTFYNQSTTQGTLSTTGFLPKSQGGSSTGFSLLPGTNLGNNNRYSAPLDFQADYAGYGSEATPSLDDWRWRAVGRANGSVSTLGLAYSNSAVGSLAIGVPLAGVSTVVAATPQIDFVLPQGGTGSASYSYKAVARSGCGTSAATSAASIGNGVSSLSSSTYNLIGLYLTSGAWGYDIYRTAGGSTQGLIGTVAITTNPSYLSNGDILFSDTGLAGDSSTPPSTNTSGCISTPSNLSAASMTLGGNTITSWPSGGSGILAWSYRSFSVGAGTVYAPLDGSAGANSPASSVAQTLGGNVSAIYGLGVTLSSAIGGSQTLAITLYDVTAASAEAVTCTVPSGGTICSDTTHSYSVPANHLMAWSVTLNSGTVATNIAIGATVGTGTSSPASVYEAGVLTKDKIYTNTQALTTGAATHTFANSFTYTSSSTFGCTCTDQTAAKACRAVPASATTVTMAGTGSDVLWLSCSGH